MKEVSVVALASSTSNHPKSEVFLLSLMNMRIMVEQAIFVTI